jgi:hypothetical protein
LKDKRRLTVNDRLLYPQTFQSRIFVEMLEHISDDKH